MSGPSDQRPMSLGVSPIMIIGVVIFISPIILNTFNINTPTWLSKVGIATIVIGVIHTVFGGR